MPTEMCHVPTKQEVINYILEQKKKSILNGNPHKTGKTYKTYKLSKRRKFNKNKIL